MCVCGSFSSFTVPLILDVCTGLQERVTDEGLRALASAGCGGNLTSLCLSGESLSLSLSFMF